MMRERAEVPGSSGEEAGDDEAGDPALARTADLVAIGDPRLRDLRPTLDRLRMEAARARAEQSLFGAAEPAKFGRYVLLGPSTDGGMGVVYAAYGPNAALVKGSAAHWKPDPDGKHGNSHWFNIACSSDALAQTELSGLPFEPIINLQTASDRLPALHMFTAKYNKGYSATVHGNPIEWSADNISSNSAAVRDGQVEAFWGNNGAVCTHHSRMWIDNKIVTLPPHQTELFEQNHAYHEMSEPEFMKFLIKGSKPEITYPCRRPTSDDFKNYLISFVVNHVADREITP